MVVYTLYDGDARVRREAETLAATGLYDVEVLALKDGNTPGVYSREGVNIRQLDVRKYRGGSPFHYILSYLRFTWKAFVVLTQRALAGTVDIVHIHNMPNFLVVAALVPILRGRKVILDIHDTMPETFSATFPPKYRRLFLAILGLEERICCAMADHIVCVNEIQREAILKRQPKARKKTLISINVPDPKRFALGASAIRTRQAHDRFRVVYHGTVSARLNVSLAVEAVARLAPLIPSIELNIVGDGEIRDQLAQLSSELGIAERVVFHPRVGLEEIVPMLEGMDLGVVPLQRNAATELMLPVKLMECLSMGIAVAAPRLPAIQHYFTEDMLFLFDPGDLGSLTKAIRTAFENPAERRSRVEHARAFLTQYDWNRHKTSLLDVYAGTEGVQQLQS